MRGEGSVSPGRLRLAVVILVGLVLSLAGPPARAQSVAKVDPRALGMGGAFVATADGWAALNWNPAGLFAAGRREVAVTYGQVPLEGGAWVEALRALRGLDSDLAGAEAADLLGEPGAGLAGERIAGAYLASTRWGVGFQQLHYIDERTPGGAGGGSGADVAAASLRAREYLVSFAQPVADGRVVLGGSLKYVTLRTRNRVLSLDALSDDQLQAAELLDVARSGPSGDANAFTADLGVLLIPSYRFRLGAVVRNVNEPEIDPETPGIDRLPRQVRAGAMVRLHPDLAWSTDVDLQSGPFVEGGRERRELSTGVEWSRGSSALRGGVLVDLDAVERSPLYTAGLGLGGDSWRLDGALTWAPDRDGFGWSGALAAEW